MAWEITLKEIVEEGATEFNKETGGIKSVITEKLKPVIQIRLEGYKPNIVKDFMAFATEKL